MQHAAAAAYHDITILFKFRFSRCIFYRCLFFLFFVKNKNMTMLTKRSGQKVVNFDWYGVHCIEADDDEHPDVLSISLRQTTRCGGVECPERSNNYNSLKSRNCCFS